MVTELITCEGKKSKGGQKPLKGAMKVIKKLKGRIGLGRSINPKTMILLILTDHSKKLIKRFNKSYVIKIMNFVHTQI